MTDEAKMKKLNDALEALMDMDPITVFQDAVTQATTEMNVGLAEMYANPKFRAFLAYSINKAIKATALRSGSMVDIAFGKSRILTLKELFIAGKRAFEELQKIKALSQKHAKEKKEGE